ncbi:hypothetical protein SAMD00019534_117580 [Acytostelium subglobosum LB1]|uniref:hypothetical protein n=1 Tax=Acytostelium subglobosum LB1 TaxID=1410327 RepID=UPI000644E7F5|nr:hypothetical protein SAMD00019534_117580 [Acytostelium subglobosum LB1]GAM28582.1 hypothetical protein SAMD00019534_117580 [Acytostelium subglobosum LB1]|eukprot:XP_012748360.1 hypothetical protein SAMD00019534_117580 [Acytostelium subglobosum LB1]
MSQLSFGAKPPPPVRHLGTSNSSNNIAPTGTNNNNNNNNSGPQGQAAPGNLATSSSFNQALNNFNNSIQGIASPSQQPPAHQPLVKPPFKPSPSPGQPQSSFSKPPPSSSSSTTGTSHHHPQHHHTGGATTHIPPQHSAAVPIPIAKPLPNPTPVLKLSNSTGSITHLPPSAGGPPKPTTPLPPKPSPSSFQPSSPPISGVSNNSSSVNNTSSNNMNMSNTSNGSSNSSSNNSTPIMTGSSSAAKAHFESIALQHSNSTVGRDDEMSPDLDRDSHGSDEKRSIFKKFPHQWAIGKLEKEFSAKDPVKKEEKEREKKEEKERKEREKVEKKERKEREKKEKEQKDKEKDKEKELKDRILPKSTPSISSKLKTSPIRSDDQPSSSPTLSGTGVSGGSHIGSFNSSFHASAISGADSSLSSGSAQSIGDGSLRGATQLDTSRGLMTWGSGSNCKLGYRSEKDSQYVPERLPNFNIPDIVSISCGSYYSALLTENGDVYMWGRGAVKNPPIATLGNGSFEDQLVPQKVEGLSEVVVISIGFYHSAALRSNGELLTWGCGEDGQLGHGDNLNQTTPRVIQSMTSHWVTQVSCGEKHTICLTKNGKVFTWGSSEYGQLGLGDTHRNCQPMLVTTLDKYHIIQIACGSSHNAVLTNHREVLVFGNGASLGTANIISIPTAVPLLKNMNIERLSCGHYSTAALTECGDVYTWGSGQELGHGHNGSESHPKLVEALRSQSIRQISCGGRHMAFLTDSGRVYTSGKDSFGQLGHSAGDQNRPKRIESLLGKFISISCGENHNAALYDTTRSFRDKFCWKLLECQRTYVRSLSIVRSIYTNPLIIRDREQLPEYLRHLPYIFLSEEEIKTIFGPFDRVYSTNSSLLHQMNNRLNTWSSNKRKIGDIMLNFFKQSEAVFNQYMDHMPAAIHMLDNMLKKAGSPVCNYLKECERLAQDRRKQETDEDNKDFSLRALLLEPLNVISRYQKNISGMVKSTKPSHIDYQGLADLEKIVDERQSKVNNLFNMLNSPTMLANYIASQANIATSDSAESPSSFLREYDIKIESLQNFKKTCLKLIKSSKKYFEVEQEAFREQGVFCENLMLAKSSLDSLVEPNLAGSLDHYSQSIKKIGYLRTELSTRTNSAFSSPLSTVADELDQFIPLIIEMRKRVFDSHTEYENAVSKLYSLAKNAQPNDKKIVEVERDVSNHKKALDKTVFEFDAIFKEGIHIEQRSLKLFYACMKAQQEYFERGLQRFQSMKPSFDALDSHFRKQSRTAWSKAIYDTLVQTFSEGKGNTVSAAKMELSTPSVVEVSHSPQGSFLEDGAHSSTPTKGTIDPHAIMAELESTDWSFVLDPPTANEFTETFVEDQYNQLVSILASPSLQVVQCVVSPCTQEEQVRTIESISKIFDSFNKIRPIIHTGIEAEVNSTANSSTLFRSNSTATKLMTAFTKMKGMPYLVKVITPLVREVVDNPNGYEVDPSKINEGTEELMTNMMNLIQMSEKFTDAIIDSLHLLPISLREISKYLQREVVRRFPDNKHSSVGGFIFLRFLCPAIIAPFTAGLVDETLGPEATRALVLIGKVLQNLANGIEFGQKESFMIPVNRFIIGNLGRINEYFDRLTDVPDYKGDYVPISSMDEVQKDIRNIHLLIVKNLSKVTKQLALYKQKDIIGQLSKTLVYLGDPLVLYK